MNLDVTAPRLSFWELLERHDVRIPLLQRDYAQGRESAREVRRNFVASLHTALTDLNAPALDLDFVYGEEPTPGVFVPLDGQQRLTTLFLLHWYAAAAGQLASAPGLPTVAETRLLRFSYETRSSSREFCRALVRQGRLGAAGRLLAQHLREAAWFQPAWERDPTVASMLTMLAELATAFGPAPGLFEQLCALGELRLGLHLLPLAQLGRPDDLYLKLNARGKALTEFEHWKAFFEQLLHQSYPAPRAEMNDRSWAEAWATQLDGSWTDLFWSLTRVTDYACSPEQLGERLLGFVECLTRLLASQAGLATSGTDFYGLCQRVYGGAKANLRFLYQALNVLSTLPDGAEPFFTTLFTRQPQVDQVAFFEEGSLNLLSQCSTGRSTYRTRALLLVLLRCGVAQGALTATDPHLRDTVRIARNVLAHAYPSTDAEAIALLDLLPALPGDMYAQLSAQAQRQPAAEWPYPLHHELAKAAWLTRHPDRRDVLHELEDQPVLQGRLASLQLSHHASRLPDFARAVQEIWGSTQPAASIGPAWLSLAPYWRHYNGSRLGDIWDLGSARNWPRGWHRLLRHPATPLPALLEGYLAAPGTTPAERLQFLAQQWLATAPSTDWRYYFVKYPALASDSVGYCTRAAGQQYELRLLTSDNLKAKHINPYVRLVTRLLADPRCPEGDAYLHNAHASPLYLYEVPDGSPWGQTVELYCREASWHLMLPAGYTLAPTLSARYQLRQFEDEARWCLTAGDSSLDRIELAVAFVRELYQAGLTRAEPVAV